MPTCFDITSFADFERTFGGIRYEYPLSYAVRDFFLNGGSQAGDRSALSALGAGQCSARHRRGNGGEGWGHGFCTYRRR